MRKYSAISDCGSEEQLASAFSSGNSGPTSKVISAVFSAVMSRLGDGARLDAGDPQLRALDQAEGVEELGLVGLVVVGAGGRDDHRAGGEQGAEDERDPPHGFPGQRWAGLAVEACGGRLVGIFRRGS